MNSLHSQCQCPGCHYHFIGGYDSNNIQQCPSCRKKFISKQNFSQCPVGHGQNSNSSYLGGSNAFYKDGCPAIMSDGRFITNYNSTNELTEGIRKMNGIKNSNEFRQFLQNNGNAIINAERNYYKANNKCRPTTSCSEGWNKLWTDNQGNWSNLDHHY